MEHRLGDIDVYMALYTSYYARQLALRPETAGEGDTIAGQVEGEKREQKSVLRRTVDLNGSLLEWKEVCDVIRFDCMMMA